MSKRKKTVIKLGDQTFPSWNQVRLYHRDLVQKHKNLGGKKKPYKTVVTNLHPDFAFLKALFSKHHQKKKKLCDKPLRRFEFGPITGSTKVNDSKWCCFVVNSTNWRVMWSAKDIGKPKTKRDEATLRSVLRAEISGQRDSFAAQHGATVDCQQCGTSLRNGKTGSKRLRPANIDHDVHEGQAFIETYRQFLPRISGKKLKLKTTKRYNTHVRVLADRKIAREWRLFHQEKTVFRFLCTTCNQQSDNKAPRKKKKNR